jgi:hypothetical protein
MDEYKATRLSVDDFLRALFTMFLLSGVACEVYLLCSPVNICSIT